MNNDKSILELILDELKEMRSDMRELSTTVAKQEINLLTHMKRSDQLEELVHLTRKELSEEIEPVKRHVHYMNGALKFLGIIATIVGILVGLFELFKAIF